MTKESLISHVFKILSQLPEDKVKEVSAFADYLLKKKDEYEIQEGIQNLINESESFDFLKDEEGLYSEEDLKKTFKVCST